MDLIRYNATEISYCKWITLTYADAMTDHERSTKMEKCFSLNLLDGEVLYEGKAKEGIGNFLLTVSRHCIIIVSHLSANELSRYHDKVIGKLLIKKRNLFILKIRI